jgi:mercuric ion transport protein
MNLPTGETNMSGSSKSDESTPGKSTSEDKMFKVGIFGSLITAVCCFTPLLVWGVIGVGLGGLVGGLDYVLFPMLFGSLGLLAQALYLNAGRPGPSPKWIIAVLVVLLSAVLIWLQFRFALRISIGAAALVALYWLYLRRLSGVADA